MCESEDWAEFEKERLYVEKRMNEAMLSKTY